MPQGQGNDKRRNKGWRGGLMPRIGVHRRSLFASSALAALLSCAAQAGAGADAGDGRLLHTDRYTLMSTGAEQTVDPLDALINISFGEGIVDVGDAVRELLRDSGYQLRYHSARNCEALNRLLFSRQLPASLRQLGPMSLRQALQMVVGRAWRLRPSELGRFVSFEVAARHRSEIEAMLGVPWEGAAGRGREVLHVFVPFGIAEFHRPKAEAVAAIARAAEQRGEDLHWSLLGHSHSRAAWATRDQARRRAEVVRTALMEAGVAPERISIRAQASNRNAAAAALRHGVDVTVLAGVSKTASYGDAACRRWDPPSGAGDIGRSPAPAANFSVQPGSLRRNIERLLRHFGLRMGNWGLSDGEYEYDWEIRHGYDIPAYAPDEALSALLGSYGIQPTLNLRDNSVDFSMLHSPRPMSGDK